MAADVDLGDLFVSVLAGEPCLEDGLACARNLVSSDIPREAIRANGVLVAAGNPEERAQALDELARLLNGGTVSGPELEFDFLVILMQTRRIITFRDEFRAFVYRMCSSPLSQLRCDAVIILLDALAADPEAENHLRVLADDPAEDVRHNARAALGLRQMPP